MAAFDFDGTLTRGDTLLPFLAAGLGWPRFAWALLRTSPWLVGHALRLVRNDVAKARLFAACLSGLPTDVAAQWAERWAREQLPRQLRGPQDPVIRQLAWHRAQGHCCVLVSASPDIYLAQAAAAQPGLMPVPPKNRSSSSSTNTPSSTHRPFVALGAIVIGSQAVSPSGRSDR